MSVFRNPQRQHLYSCGLIEQCFHLDGAKVIDAPLQEPQVVQNLVVLVVGIPLSFGRKRSRFVHQTLCAIAGCGFQENGRAACPARRLACRHLRQRIELMHEGRRYVGEWMWDGRDVVLRHGYRTKQTEISPAAARTMAEQLLREIVVREGLGRPEP